MDASRSTLDQLPDGSMPSSWQLVMRIAKALAALAGRDSFRWTLERRT